MDIAEYFPIWEQLTEEERETISRTASWQAVKKGTILHNGSADCTGLSSYKEDSKRTAKVRSYVSVICPLNP